MELTWELIREYLEGLTGRGHSETTVESYRRSLERFYAWLPGEKKVLPHTLEQWGEALAAQGYSVRTVNLSLSAVNSLLTCCGRRELCAELRPLAESTGQPELTRQEYLRMLTTARALGKEREYCLIKVFGSTGLTVRSLHLLTVEAARAGEVPGEAGAVQIPEHLCGELLDYARRRGIRSGPLFVNRQGRPLDRTSVTSVIRRFCRDAQVEEEKATPRCLHKLYLSTRAQVRAGFDRMAEQRFGCLLEMEHASMAWEEG